MPIVFFILILILSAILGFIVLIQNPKGGGLSGNVGSFGNQVMGVKQTTDALEKGTWLFAGIIGLLCIISVTLFKGSTSAGPNLLNNVNTNAPVQQAQPSAVPTAPATNDQPQQAPETPAKK
ncbi:MAG: preprotein translocase subunit SecG [Chitinophagaceae bacterium]|jgi:preprotein translocase subunit SecG|nr:preprotein translocase subunit SecG [Chitinophagaceae bacterium]